MDDVTLWLNKLKTGDEEAARQIWNGFFERVQRLADRKLGSLPQRAGDAEDVALSALNALCIGAREDKFRQLEDRDDLWQVLAMITARKAAQSWRKQSRRGEVGESVLRQPDDAGPPMQNLPDASPAFVDSISETCAELLGKLDDRLREVALLRMEGHSNQEIADQLGRSVKSVERYMKVIRESWSGEA